MVCIRIVWWIFWRGVVAGALLGALFGTFILPFVGTIYGFLYGALIGLIMGAVDAFALGATAHFFMDMNHPSRIVPWLRLIGITLNLVGVGLFMCLFFGVNFVIAQPIFSIIPPILSAIAISFLCPYFVNYAVHIQQDDPQPVTNPTIIW